MLRKIIVDEKLFVAHGWEKGKNQDVLHPLDRQRDDSTVRSVLSPDPTSICVLSEAARLTKEDKNERIKEQSRMKE